ncbi:MAG: prolipoprotein diacylglyceryl transferase [Candidatus Promineifilaceae bacterium]
MLDFLQIDPVAFTIPIGDGFDIHWYGIIVTLGIAVGAWWAGREVMKRGGNVDEFYNGLILVIVAGFVFARGWYVIQELIAGRGSQYDSLSSIINVRAGGLNILGGFIGAAILAYVYIRWRRVDFWLYADVAGPALLIAQAIGRWGNFINQELHGQPTELPWGILVDPPRTPPYNDLVQYPLDTRFHPTFFYESLWLLLGFVILVLLNRRYRDKWPYGTLFGLFMIWWGGGRAWIEIFRPDQPTFGNSAITYSMVISILIALSGLLIVLYRNNKLPERLTNRRKRRRIRKPKPKRELD